MAMVIVTITVMLQVTQSNVMPAVFPGMVKMMMMAA